MTKIKKLIAVMLILAMGVVSAFATPAECGNIFPDVTGGHWAFQYISDMVEQNILSGYPDGTFRPEEKVSRAEFARIITGTAELEAKSVAVSSFADVAVTDWHSPYIEAVKHLLEGYSLGGEMMYEPNAKALREDVAVAMVKMKGYDVSAADIGALEATFTDHEEISELAKKHIAVAFKMGLISGYEDNTFRPKSTITRAEAATLLWRACQDEEDIIEPTPSPEITPKPTHKPVESPDPTKKPEGIYSEPHTFETTLAVVQKTAQDYTTQDGEDVEIVQVLYMGEENIKLIFETGFYSETGLGVGDVFFFGTNRFGHVDEVFIIYDYSADEFMNLATSEWSSNLWDEGKDYQLAEGYIVDIAGEVITLATRTAIEAGYLDTSIDVDDDHENGVGVFELSGEGLAYEFDAFNDNIVGVANRLGTKNIWAVKGSALDKYETEDGVFEGDLLNKANYAVVIIEDGTVIEIYTIVK